MAAKISDKHVIYMLMRILYEYDAYTFEHCIHTALYANAVGQFMLIEEEELYDITVAALLHDIGKVMIPEEILCKPDKLNAAEKAIMDTHTTHGYNIVKEIGLCDYILDAIVSHHENENGTGYPKGISASELNMGAKIIHVCDVYDAMLRKRIYRDAIPHEIVIEHINKNAGNMFDPDVVSVLASAIDDYRARIIKPDNDLLLGLIDEFMSK